jgi:UDP-3-O-[3-hydroxymyristoyl] glucosamine N-acyltransferase
MIGRIIVGIIISYTVGKMMQPGESIISNISGRCTPRFQLKNVVKTMNNIMVLKNKGTDEHKDIEESLSHDDINDMFSTIDMSCDSIINNKKKQIDIINAEEQTQNITHNSSTSNNVVITDNFVVPENAVVPENVVVNENAVVTENVVNNKTIILPLENITMVSEENSDEISISVSEASQITIDETDQPRKKRAYKPRKKKDAL